MTEVVIPARVTATEGAGLSGTAGWLRSHVGNLWMMSLLVMAVFWIILGAIAALVTLENRQLEQESVQLAAAGFAEYLSARLASDSPGEPLTIDLASILAGYSRATALRAKDLDLSILHRSDGRVLATTSSPGGTHWLLRAGGGEEVQTKANSHLALVPVPGHDLRVLGAGNTSARLPGYYALLAAIGVVFTLFKSQLTLARVRRLNEQQSLIDNLRKSQAQEHRANEMKTKFIATISHELRTPLNSILGFSELIQLSPQDAENSRFAQLIHESGKHLLSLVNALLDMAKIEAGRMEIDIETFNAVQVAKDVTDLHRASAVTKGLEMRFSGCLPSRAWIQTDKTKFVQILNNLLSNAVKFTDQGSIRVTCDEEDGVLRVTVTDTGKGIASERLEDVFTRFTSHGSDKGEGTGLGLALSKELARLLKGTLTLQSNPLTGTWVQLGIPVGSAPETRPEDANKELIEG